MLDFTTSMAAAAKAQPFRNERVQKPLGPFPVPCFSLPHQGTEFPWSGCLALPRFRACVHVSLTTKSAWNCIRFLHFRADSFVCLCSNPFVRTNVSFAFTLQRCVFSGFDCSRPFPDRFRSLSGSMLRFAIAVARRRSTGSHDCLNPRCSRIKSENTERHDCEAPENGQMPTERCVRPGQAMSFVKPCPCTTCPPTRFWQLASSQSNPLGPCVHTLDNILSVPDPCPPT